MEVTTKRGRVSAYGFGCGYVEIKDSGPLVTRIWMEHTRYHVRQTDVSENIARRVFWEVFDKLKDARELFNNQPGDIQ